MHLKAVHEPWEGRSVLCLANHRNPPDRMPTVSCPSRWLYVSLATCMFSLTLTLPAWRRKELRHRKKQTWGRDLAGRGMKGTHGSGQRSTRSLVSEGEMRFWLLRTMSSFWALLVSTL